MPFVTSRDGTRIGYSVVGSGPAIVLVDRRHVLAGYGSGDAARRRAEGPLHGLYL